MAVAAGQSSPVSLTGALYTDPIKEQMAAIETQYSQTTPDFPNIALSNVDFGFEAVLTLPEGMAYTDASKSAMLSGSDDFKVSSVVVSGQTATVKFALTDAAKAKVTTYADLKAIGCLLYTSVLHGHQLQDRRDARRRLDDRLDGTGKGTRHHDYVRRRYLFLER